MNIIPNPTLSDIVTDFLASAPSLEELAAYRLPDAQQARAHELLDKKRNGSLTDTEADELAAFRQIDHLLTLVKAKARLRLQSQS